MDRSISNLVKNQNETMLWIANPPAKESIANNPDSLATIFFYNELLQKTRNNQQEWDTTYSSNMVYPTRRRYYYF